jgi:hypothetical protein
MYPYPVNNKIKSKERDFEFREMQEFFVVILFCFLIKALNQELSVST